MDDSMLCLLKEYETAKEIPRYIEQLNKKVMNDLEKKIKSILPNYYHIVEDNIYESANFTFCKPEWMVNDLEDWLICFSFEVQDSSDDYDYWINNLIGFSKYPFSIYCNFNGLISNGYDKNAVKDIFKDVTKILAEIGFSEVPQKSKKSYYFSKPITFDKNTLVEAYENNLPEDAFQPLDSLFMELEEIIPYIDKSLMQAIIPVNNVS